MWTPRSRLTPQSLAPFRHDAIDADAAIDYALGLAAAPGQRWQSGSLSAKQRLQQVFFPKRLQFEDGEFRTSELAFFSSTCERIAGLIPGW